MIHVHELANMSTSGSESGSSTPSTHPSDDEWEEVTNTSPSPGIDVMTSSSSASGSSKEPSQMMVAKLSAMQNVFLCVAQHVDWVKNPKGGSRQVLLEVIGKALYDHDFNPTDIVDYIDKTPRSLPKGKELIKLRELHHARDSNGKQYGEKRPALNLCEEVMNLCVDVYLNTDSPLSAWVEETKGIKDVPEWEEVVNTSYLPGIDVTKSSSAAPGSCKEPSKADLAKFSAMQNVFLFMKVHVDPLYQKPLTRKMLLEYVTVALYDHDLNPTDIVDYIGKTPRNLPKGEELKRWRLLNQSRDSNGIQYGEKRPEALNLCEEVMNLCIDVYLDVVSTRAWEKETKRIKDTSAATTHTTATTGKVKTMFNPTKEFMKHATPSLTSTSYHPAKLQTCVPPLKGSVENVPKAPKIIAPSTVPKTASATNGTSQDLLAMAKEIHAKADLIKKGLEKSTATDSLQQSIRKPHPVDNVVSHVQLPSTPSMFKGENRQLYTQPKQRKSPFESLNTSSPSITSGGLNDEPMKPLYSRPGAKEASLWKADMIYATQGLPTQKSFAQQLSHQLDNQPMAYDGGKFSGSLWSKSNTQSWLLANGPEPGDAVKDGKLVGKALGLNRHADITDAAASTAAGLADLPPRQKFEKALPDHATNKVVGKTDSVESDMSRIAENAKGDAGEKAAEALAALIPSQRFEKRSLPASKVSGSKLGDVSRDGKLIGNIVDPNHEAAIQKARDAAGLTPTQRLEKLSPLPANVHGSMLGDIFKDGKLVRNNLDPNRHAGIQMEMAVEALSAFTPTQKFEKPSLPAVNVRGLGPTYILENGKPLGNTFDPTRLAALQRGRERFVDFQKERDAALVAFTPTQKFEKTLTDHSGSKIPSSMFFPAGYPNSHLTAHVERAKHPRVSETAVKKGVAPKAMDRVPAVKEQFKEGPVTPPTEKQFEQGRATPQKKEPVTPLKKEVKHATWIKNGDNEPGNLVKIAMVPVAILVLCTIIQIMMNLGTIMSTIASVISSCLSLCMDYTGYFWSGVWWLIKSPFLLFGYVGGLIGGLVNQGINFRPTHPVAPPSAPSIFIEPGPPTIPAMQEAISLWDALGAEKAKHPQCANSLQLSSEVSTDSPTGIQYKSVHKIGNSGWGIDSDYPFTRHNNSMPEADRCEHFVKSFQHFWKEEMEEKKEKEGTEGRFDLALGNDLAEVLSRYCK